MPALAGHQAHTLDAKHPGDGFKLRTQGLKLQINQIGAVQINRIALITPDLAALDVDAVGHQQVENVAKDANPVLAVDFDTHGQGSGITNNGCPMWERACSRRLKERHSRAGSLPQGGFPASEAFHRHDFVTVVLSHSQE